MPTTTIQVAAVTSPDQWTLGAGANKVVAVNGPDDDDASYISATVGQQEQYNLQSNTIPVGSTINSVSTSARFKRSTTYGYTRIYLGANYTTSPAHGGSSYATYVDALARPGGGTWQQADLSSIQVAVLGAGASGEIRCTSLWLIVDYTPPANTGQFFQLFR